MHAFQKCASVKCSLRSSQDTSLIITDVCLPQDGSSVLISQHISGAPISSCASALTFPRSSAGAVCVAFGRFHDAGSALSRRQQHDIQLDKYAFQD
ncbi:hypothetical protein PO909_026632 [Leuciscus waleckii]